MPPSSGVRVRVRVRVRVEVRVSVKVRFCASMPLALSAPSPGYSSYVAAPFIRKLEAFPKKEVFSSISSPGSPEQMRSRAREIPAEIITSHFKIQDSRFKIQDSRFKGGVV